MLALRLQPEALDPMIVGIENEQAPLRITGDSPGLVELPFAAAIVAKGSEELAIGRELLHAMIAQLTEINVAVAVTGQGRVVEQDIVWIIELARFTTLLAPR